MASISGKNQNPSVLLVTLWAHGHLNPMLRLGKTLVSKNLNVTLATTHSALKNRSSADNPVGGVHLEFFSDGLPIDYNRTADMDYYMDTLEKFGPINLLALIQSYPRKFACIILNPFLPWVADVAAGVDTPAAMLWIQPCTLYQIYYRFYNQLDEFPTESNPDLNVKLPGLPDFSSEELPSFVLPTNTFRSFDSILKIVFHNTHKFKWVLGNSFTELEKDVIASVNNVGNVFLPVGPIVPATLFGKQDSSFNLYNTEDAGFCLEWLNKQKPSSVIYVSFGTLIFSSEIEIERIAAGLKNTNRPFIWVLRSPENQELPELRVLEEIKKQGLIVNWAPQTEVLSHPSIGCFMSHCGWNSLLESLVFAGVPVIACPRWTDQPTNAKLVTDVWGVGVKMKKSLEGLVSGEEVERCVEEVMSGRRAAEFRRNAAEWKTVAREALAEGGSSDKNIEIFVNEIISS